MRVALPRRERDAGGADHLIGAYEPLRVPGSKAGGATRVELSQLLAKSGAAQSPMEFDGLTPDLLRDFRNRRQTLLERPDVKTAAADQNRQPSGGGGEGDFIQRQPTPIGDGAALAGVQKAVEPMRRAFFGSGI